MTGGFKKHHPPTRCFVIVAGLALIVGCGGGPSTSPVSGVVTMDGQPLRFGSVVFQNITGGQPSKGDIQPDGAFTLSTFRANDGAIVGKNRARVVCYDSQDPANQRTGPMGDSLGTLLIPRKYTSFGASGLVYDIAKEQNAPIQIELTSSK